VAAAEEEEADVRGRAEEEEADVRGRAAATEEEEEASMCVQ
jgi:hypothetical protein